MTGSPAGPRPGSPLRRIAGLAAGLLLLDVLVNVPSFSASSPIRSLLVPSIDLLVLVALCMAIAQAAALATRRALRAGFGAVAAGFVACAAGLRFGWDAGGAGSWALVAVLVIAVGLAGFAGSGLLVGGLEAPLVRSLLLLAISLAAVLQVVSGRRVFTPSVVPRLLSLIR